MIPKIIHYCWFGNNEKGSDVKAYLGTWHEQCPDYSFVEWNEENFDIDKSCDYVRQAYAAGKWAFVTDYVRLYALYNHGGIYLDTDVEVIKAYDPLLNDNAFLCAESQYSICTATIGAEKGSEFIEKILEQYENRKFITEEGYDVEPNSQYIFKWLRDNYQYNFSEGTVHNLGICTVYPRDFFSPINCYTLSCDITGNTYSVHRYAGTWKTEREKKKEKLMACVTRLIGEKRRERLKQFLRGKR